MYILLRNLNGGKAQIMSTSEKKRILKSKIIITGEPGVGKSFIAGAADTCIPSQEIGVSIGKISETIQDLSSEITLMTWAITERRPKVSTHLEFAQAAVIACDLSKPKTIEQTPKWARRIQRYAGNIPLFFVGNKVDLANSDSYSHLRKIANKYDSFCFPIRSNDLNSARDLLKTIAWELSENPDGKEPPLVSW
jgi:GTPase SAR1 family protein